MKMSKVDLDQQLAES